MSPVGVRQGGLATWRFPLTASSVLIESDDCLCLVGAGKVGSHLVCDDCYIWHALIDLLTLTQIL